MLTWPNSLRKNLWFPHVLIITCEHVNVAQVNHINVVLHLWNTCDHMCSQYHRFRWPNLKQIVHRLTFIQLHSNSRWHNVWEGSTSSGSRMATTQSCEPFRNVVLREEKSKDHRVNTTSLRHDTSGPTESQVLASVVMCPGLIYKTDQCCNNGIIFDGIFQYVGNSLVERWMPSTKL